MFFVGSDGCRTGEGCVLLGFGATGFDYPRLDGCTARANPGERACFDVTLMNTVPVGALQTSITIPSRRIDFPIDFSTLLAPVSVIATPRAAGFEAAWTADGSTAKVVLYSVTGATIPPGRGAVLHVCYAVKDETPEGICPLLFGPSLVSSPEGDAIPFCPTFAEIEGRICVGVSRCDLNGDGVGDVRDIIRMVRCILATPSELCPRLAPSRIRLQRRRGARRPRRCLLRARHPYARRRMGARSRPERRTVTRRGARRF